MGNVVHAPHARWGGKWKAALERLEGEVGDEWTELTGYARTTGYQVARALNLGVELPEPPEGKVYEFGTRENVDKTSTLFVRLRDAATER